MILPTIGVSLVLCGGLNLIAIARKEPFSPIAQAASMIGVLLSGVTLLAYHFGA